jgi:undecaprenyl pyrophosphate phosphatase UppP
MTLTTRTRRSGRSRASRSAAARISFVGTIPAAASTTSGSIPSSVLAQRQIDAPAVACAFASSIDSHCGSGCFVAMTRLM